MALDGDIYKQATRFSNPVKICDLFIETILHFRIIKQFVDCRSNSRTVL